jgi:hypothetical protein
MPLDHRLERADWPRAAAVRRATMFSTSLPRSAVSCASKYSQLRRLLPNAMRSNPVISNRCHVNALPPSMCTLYELTKLPEEILRQKLKDGSINPKLERKDVAR